MSLLKSIMLCLVLAGTLHNVSTLNETAANATTPVAANFSQTNSTNQTTAVLNASTTTPSPTTSTTGQQTTAAINATTPVVPCGLEDHICSPREPPPTVLPAPRFLPQGVTELAPRGEEEGTDLGPCVCDLTVSICDANCNCDPDCDDHEKGRFTAEYGVEIKSEGFEEDIGECVAKDQFLRINAPVERDDSPLCVVVNNNPSLGNFFTPPGPGVSDDEVRLEFSEYGVGPWVPYAPPAQPDAPAYEVGMRIPTAIASAELGSTDTACSPESCVPGVYGPLGFLSVPYPGPSGRCVPGSFVRFWEGTEATGPCVEGGAAAAVCGADSPLAAAYHVGNLMVARKPSQLELLTEWAIKAKWLEVAVEVAVEGEGDGLYTARSLPAPALDEDGRCVNVMKSLHLALVRDSRGEIAAATALVRLAHVRPGGEGQVWVQQHFSVDFLDADTAARTQPALLAPLQRSGNPGYVAGRPVRAGYVNSSLPEGSELAVAVEQLVQGLRLPRMARADGACAVCAESAEAGGWQCDGEAAAAALAEDEGVGVLFGQDLTLGCELRLSRPELRAFCEAGALHPLLRYDPRLRVGVWGDAEPANHFDWLPARDANPPTLAQNREPEASQNWNARGVCESAPTSIHLQFLTADVGNVRNPQRKILGARVAYGLTDLHARRPDDTSRAAYALTASVSFLRIDDGGSVEVVPPPPSLLPVLPDDIFYPFSSPAPAHLPSSRLALLCFAAVVVGLRA